MSGYTDADAFLWRGKRMESFGVGSTTKANGINNLGDIVGNDGHGAFARLRGKITGLPEASHVEPRDPSGEMGDVNQSSGVGINDRRLILINSTYGGKRGDTSLLSRPFLVDGNARRLRLTPVPLPKDCNRGAGVALNRRGTVLATASGPGRPDVVPYLVRAGRIVALPFAGAMNGRDEVVGGSPPALWRDGRTTPLPSFPGWKLQSATGINDKGWICGTGERDGKVRGFVLEPW